MKKHRNKIIAFIMVGMIFGISIFYFPNLKIVIKKSISKWNETNSLSDTVATFESAYKGELSNTRQWIDTYGFIQKYIGKREIKNFRIISDDEGCLYTSYGMESDAYIELVYSDIEKMYNTTIDCGGDFIFVQTPFKSMQNNQNLIGYKKDYLYYNYDRLLIHIEENEIPYMDLRDYDSWEYYKTDHHWTAMSAFRATGLVIGELDNIYNLSLDSDGYFKDINNYSRIVYEDSLLGSAGIQVGEYYVGKDDVAFLVPDFATNLSWEHYVGGELNNSKNGDFTSTFINQGLLDNKEYYNKFNAFLNGGYCENIIINKEAKNDKKVLLVMHSYGRPMAMYLSLYFRETRYLDPQTGRYNENYLDYIQEYNPDVVIVMYNGRINTGE